MREIKFRSYNKKEKKMIYYHPLKYLDECLGTNNIQHGESYIDDYYAEDQDNFILMQYTGLKDKNGKEIYEGDIWYDDNLHGIDFYDGSFAISVLDIFSFIRVAKASQIYFDDKEIIGNIYENPKLIKNK
jgi:uncharacterized phage protein (TIGR01671 family)